MNESNPPGAVSQKIFQMGLSVETVSVYLLCTGLVEAGTTLSLKNLMNIWNGTPSQLRDGLKHLEAKNVLHRIISDQADNAIYKISNPEKWQCH